MSSWLIRSSSVVMYLWNKIRVSFISFFFFFCDIMIFFKRNFKPVTTECSSDHAPVLKEY